MFSSKWIYSVIIQTFTGLADFHEGALLDLFSTCSTFGVTGLRFPTRKKEKYVILQEIHLQSFSFIIQTHIT